MAKSNLSGKAWWKANQGKAIFGKSNNTSDLDSKFKSVVEKFRKALKKAKANVKIDTTKRSYKRAHVLHYAWQVAKGKVKANKVPAESGVDIEWDHGDDKKSIAGAKEIVKEANMASIASLTSNHILGKAIDWTITWKGDLEIVKADGKTIKITSKPKNGGDPGNTELHAVG